MSINLPDFFHLLKQYIRQQGGACRVDHELVLWDGLYISGDFISSGGKCVRAQDLADALRVTANPQCVEKKTSMLAPPYVEYIALGDYALLAAVGRDGVYLVENEGASIRCICKVDLNIEVFKKAVDVLMRWHAALLDQTAVGKVY
ncbi:paREP5 [Pyrobaculum oguniense TE7]|uniref:PaREP5 n=1 Tax=Pyrobaculum oguniense (strain DSM 13380 / JCM 10595 / TE7) TaxID=698757 RepID=H6Q9X7_PYROT|nr:paREP5 [Pyrobaculum oguniense TE7]